MHIRPTIPELTHKEVLESVGLQKRHLILPLFVQERREQEELKISMMPGITKVPLDKVTQRIQAVIDAGITSIIIFGIPKKTDERGSLASSTDGVVQQALKKIRKGYEDHLNIITDVCLCQYNTSGHCGLIINNEVDNDSTLESLSKIALSHAEAGADIVAPSSMMDGQVYSIRKMLKRHGFQKTKILSYSVKQLSSLYVPFRSAAFSNMSKFNVIDKSSYQVSYTNSRQILREIGTDVREGADMLMIKPGMTSLDLICMIKENFDFPIAVQNVSGEYAMIKAAAMHGWISEEDWIVGSIASIKRTGADMIVSYFSMDIAKYLDD
ncbi:MAG TPA: porphobilinogen synthase [Nitrososphaeraceae archaeon]|nr:porphobilinogen synthase [Nitrososphaeraceae archaeon]